MTDAACQNGSSSRGTPSSWIRSLILSICGEVNVPTRNPCAFAKAVTIAAVDPFPLVPAI